MITLTTSQQAAIANPAVEPRIGLELETSSGKLYISSEPFYWSGNSYYARLANPGQIAAALGDSSQALAATKSLTVEVANPDGFFSRPRPNWIRQHVMTAKEIFLDVESDAVSQMAFTVVGAQMPPGGDTYQITGEDLFANYRRRLFPSNEVIITRSMYPQQLQNGPGLGRPIPVIWGRSMTPCYHVDGTSADVYVACVGSATWGASSLFCDLFDGGFSAVVGLFTTTPYSLYYANRGGVPVTEIICDSSVPIGNPQQLVRYADLVMPQNSQDTTPDRVLTEMLLNTWAGVCFDPSFIDSASLLTARNYYQANSYYFDGGAYEQRPLEDWLSDWQHDATARINLRDTLRISVQASRSAQSSFYVGNILQATLSQEDNPLALEEGRHKVFFRDRTRDSDWLSFQKFEVGSGQEIDRIAPFIGRPTVAARPAQFWAKDAYYGVRNYGFTSTVKAIAHEEGDLVTLTHSQAGTSNQLAFVMGVGRRAGLYDVSLKEANADIFAYASPGEDPAFLSTYQRAPYNAGSFSLRTAVQLLVVSHQLAGTPIYLRPVIANGYEDKVSVQLLAAVGGPDAPTTNNSQFVVLEQALVVPNDPNTNRWDIRADLAILGWDIFLFKSGA